MNDEVRSVRCMLLPLSSLNLVIPNSGVAEIIGYSTPRPVPDTSDWFLGVVSWRGVDVPVVSLEEMCAIDSVHVGPRARIGIIYNPEKDPEIPYLGIHMQDIPRAYLAESDKMEAGSDDGLSQYLLSRVDEDHQARAIPDLDRIIAELKTEYDQEKIDQMKA
ncbi:MAG: chemotaxis protein CheW [Proteobacteria bacterium]|nr:chemotaxis protein CheW [Pseudomonadota bacterium]